MAASMAAGSGVRVLADKVGPGGTAALVVFVLIIACIAIFLALVGSLRRLRQRVSDGTFNAQGQSHAGKSGAAASAEATRAKSTRAKSTRAKDVVTRDPGGQGGADV